MPVIAFRSTCRLWTLRRRPSTRPSARPGPARASPPPSGTCCHSSTTKQVGAIRWLPIICDDGDSWFQAETMKGCHILFSSVVFRSRPRPWGISSIACVVCPADPGTMFCRRLWVRLPALCDVLAPRWVARSVQEAMLSVSHRRRTGSAGGCREGDGAGKGEGRRSGRAGGRPETPHVRLPARLLCAWVAPRTDDLILLSTLEIWECEFPWGVNSG